MELSEYYWNTFLSSGQVSDYLRYVKAREKPGENRRRIKDSSYYKQF